MGLEKKVGSSCQKLGLPSGMGNYCQKVNTLRGVELYGCGSVPSQLYDVDKDGKFIENEGVRNFQKEIDETTLKFNPEGLHHEEYFALHQKGELPWQLAKDSED